MSVTQKQLTDLKVKQIDPHTFGDAERAVVVLGTGSSGKVLLLLGPANEDGYVLYASYDLPNLAATELEGFIAGLFKVSKAGSDFHRVRSLTAPTGGTVCGFERGEQLCLQVQGEKGEWLEPVVTTIYHHR